MRKINLLQVVYGFSVGGAELKLLELVSRLNRNLFNMSIVCVGINGPLEERFRALGLPVYMLPKARRFDYTLPVKLARLARSLQTDIMMTTLFFADIIGALSTYIYKPKALISWEAITGQLRPHQKKMYQWTSSRFDKVVAVSNSIWPYIQQDRGMDPGRIQTIYYGVDLRKYATAEPHRERSSYVFGTAARLVHQKGHTYLLDAIPDVLADYPQASWVFAGTGDKEAELQEKCRKMQLESRVTFLGRRNDVPELLADWDAFILPSLWEGFPNVLLEAMARCRPVIATRVEGSEELVVHEQTGLLVDKQNPAALAQAMKQILADRERSEAWGRAGRKRVEDHFSVGKQIMEFEELYLSFV
jgi:L-malate glycosyltransferase